MDSAMYFVFLEKLEKVRHPKKSRKSRKALARCDQDDSHDCSRRSQGAMREDQAGATEHAQSGENQAGTVPLDQAGGEVHVRVHPCRQKE